MLSQSDRERQVLYDFTDVWNLNNKINNQNRDRLIDREQTDGCHRGGKLGDSVKR